MLRRRLRLPRNLLHLPRVLLPPLRRAAQPPAPPKEAPPKPEPLDNDLVKRYKARALAKAFAKRGSDRKQSILVVDAAQCEEIARFTRDIEQFNLLADLTAVDWPRRKKRFDVVLNLYSFAKNERLPGQSSCGRKGTDFERCRRLVYSQLAQARSVGYVRDCFQRTSQSRTRILLPDEWQGFPLRKDYDITDAGYGLDSREFGS